jgi:hypothetical protein
MNRMLLIFCLSHAVVISSMEVYFGYKISYKFKYLPNSTTSSENYCMKYVNNSLQIFMFGRALVFPSPVSFPHVFPSTFITPSHGGYLGSTLDKTF